MKYIRTKDGQILERRGTRFVQASHGPNYYVRVGTGDYSHYIPYKEADTIEELCDRFVCHGHRVFNRFNKETKMLLSGPLGVPDEFDAIAWVKHGIHIYGAIWTEWGLKYVAKLNEEGEWELL